MAAERFVIDACALIAYLNGEDGANVFDELLQRADNHTAELHASSVNLYEVYYDCLRRDEQTAQQLLVDLYHLPLLIVETFERNLMVAAGHFKVRYRVSLADSIALALAQQLGARLVSTDHHEFDPIEQAGEVQLKWLR